MIARKHTMIIAEAGVNHNGDLNQAKALIKVAADAGADYIKFQTFRADKIVSRKAEKATYQVKNFNKADNTQYGMLRKLEMPLSWYDQLVGYAKQLNIQFLSTPFDKESIDFLSELNPDLYKIPSGEITNKPYLQHIAKKGKPIVMSTGMADLNEVKQAIDVLQQGGLNRRDLTILHCNTEYPTPMNDVNLMAMRHMQNELGVKVGYSDHTLGIEVPIAAVSLGASIIEKHFTLDRTLPGPDHKASLEPFELKSMVIAIRNIELAISGSGIKEPSISEKLNKISARKSVHILNNLKPGHILSEKDLIMKRPGDGISPMEIDKIIGATIGNELKEDTKLSWKDLN